MLSSIIKNNTDLGMKLGSANSHDVHKEIKYDSVLQHITINLYT